MAKDGRKAGIVLGVGAAIGGVILAIRAKAVPEPPPEQAGATIAIQVFDEQGRLVPASSPITLEEGSRYTVVVLVTNQSTRAGQPSPATLFLLVMGNTDVRTILGLAKTRKDYAAGETKETTHWMDVPAGSGGESGQIIAEVQDPNQNEVASTVEYFTIGMAPIIYGATVTIS